MFDFQTIEDKSFQNSVVKVLINNISNKNKLDIANLNLKIIHSLCEKNKLKYIDDIKTILFYKINLSKKENIKYNNSFLKYSLFYNNVLQNKYIITSIYEYIIETLMIISKPSLIFN